MIESQPSLTAERVAIRRAAHQLLDRPIVFEDPLALRVLGEEGAAAVRAHPERLGGRLLGSRLRAFLAVRSRVAEDALAEASDRGVRRYVVLGAGLDTFAYRNPYPNLHVVEVDHPATQTWKRERLAAAGIEVPAGVTFAPVDFATESLTEALYRIGVDPGQRTFFSWLGVTPYLESETALATLLQIAPFAAAGGGVVFDYAVPPSSLGPLERAAFEALAARVAAAGEPFRGFFDPADLEERMLAMGFHDIRDLTGEEMNRIFFSNRTDGLEVAGRGHILTAWA